jgi:BNR repeat-like domain
MVKLIWLCALCALVTSCGSGGGGGDSGGGSNPPPPPPVIPAGDGTIRVSAASPFAANCAEAGGTLFANAEVEPHLAVNPANPNNLIAAWQQDRWSNGSSQGLATSVSFDGGATWANTTIPFSNCSGGNAANGGDYLRATDPWVTFSPNGVAYQMALSTSGARNAMLVSRSADNGRTWNNPVTLILDGADAFNDKNAITADTRNNNFVYAVWDRLAAAGGGAAYFARTINGGQSWEAARNIYDPGVSSQTIGNIVVSLPSGAILNFFTQIDSVNNRAAATLNVIRSIDNGATWGPRIRVADLLSVGTRDPETGTAIRDGGILGSIAVAPNGEVHVVWQDSRFSSGVRDEVALSTSRDGGLTWALPSRVTGGTGVAAFVPTVAVSADGTIGVTYYDFRSNTADATTLLTDYWLANSRDGGATWAETRVSPAFDLANAPVSAGRGYFLGDYQGLVASGNVFVPLFVRTNSGNTANRTDVFAARIQAKSAGDVAAKSAATTPTEFVADAALRQSTSASINARVSENVIAQMAARRLERSRLINREIGFGL